jgi:hypothetical protein
MIDIGKIIKRSWHILWNYRILWVFGFLLAITGGGGGSSGSSYQFNGNSGNAGGNGNNPNYNPNFQPGPFLNELTTWFNENVAPLFTHPEKYVSTFIWIGLAIVLFILIMTVITSLIRYPAETAVIRMVDDYEQTSVKVDFKQGWKLGWNRRAFRLWLIDFIIGLPSLLILALLLVAGVAIYLSVSSGANALAVGGTISAIGCTFLFIFIFAILMVLVGLLRQFFVRSVALEDTGVRDSFRNGWDMFKRNWKSTGLMWLVMLGIGIGYGIVAMILFFLLIPAYIVMILPAAIVAAIPGGIVLALTSIFAAGPLAWILAGIVTFVVFIFVVLTPLTFVSGLYLIFSSNIWTLTYREIKALEAVKPEELPAPAA